VGTALQHYSDLELLNSASRYSHTALFDIINLRKVTAKAAVKKKEKLNEF
jgi:hypothetical protein